ncbi:MULTISPECIES: sensor histidine kinase [unclassified Microbacterium]|uniref:sensor histidine kinase n=1 Tax=unclassified Microbacterium TaxID=2609290 RepID=UPI000EA86455|nr:MULTISPECIES: histidine kinase [unclassified Microbacterium]MBT2483174.1 ATP-binding protein [Microbacterium sp. ISL-108]RKN66229.1 ATP-binding protein [Microbacterium sp. CGR2]
MSRTRSRSDSIREDEELRLPRAPGVLRRFWARHPVVVDVLITAICLLLSLGAAARIDPQVPEPWALVFAVLAPVTVTVACATLLWRRRAPLVGFIAAFSLELLFLLGMAPGGSPLVIVSCYALAVYGSSRTAWIALGVGAGVVSAVALPLMLTEVIPVQDGVNSILNCVVLGLIGTLIGVNVGERKRYLTAIIDRSRQLLVERDQQAQLAAAAERARIAREMHDIVSHSLTVIVALSEGAVATPDRDQARAASTSAAETARGALAEMRSMLGVLRDPDSPLPLAPMEPTPPRDTVSAAQRAGYPVSFTVSGDAEVSPAVAHAVGRIVQEGVTNAMRHAPAATTIAVRLAYETDTVTIEIVNDGVTGTADTGGFGIQGLIERAAHVNGRVRSEPDDGGRWVLRAELPATAASPSTPHPPMEELP